MIEIIGTALTQWDTGRLVQVTGVEADHVHFANHGDSKAVIMGIADSQAKIPDYLLQTGKQLCVYAVKNGITLESKTFYVKHRERPENYVYDDDRRNYIYELITNAEAATEGANSAAESANLAAKIANDSVASANAATENANKSAGDADLAAKSATEAADKAKHTAKSLMVVGSSEGESIHLDDAIDQFLVGLRVFGKTTQAGTPTPDAPVDLVSVGGGGSITVNVSGENDPQTMTISTPNGLRGIPVTSGGNFTDTNGQQWICDEIDLDRGVHVQRAQSVTFNGTENWVNGYRTGTGQNRFELSTSLYGVPGANIFVPAMCNKFQYEETMAIPAANHFRALVSNGMCYILFNPSTDLVPMEDLSAWKTWLAQNPITVVIPARTTTETPLSEEELAAFAALRTYRGNTTVSNDASAHMEIEYVMDAKTYIGRLITGITSPGRVVNVSLPASKWTGSGNLYSQVVSIDGITENSQVNLTPSVEQLSIFYEKDVTFITENDGGVVTVYVIGEKPTNDYTIMASVVEVIA